MATGIPGKNGNISNSISKSDISFQLNYEGKISIQDILTIPPAKLKPVVTVDKQPKNKLIYGENLRVLSSLLNDTTPNFC
jgi:adenine-specific DNA-methyltransferase